MGVELGGPGVDHSHPGYPHRPMNPVLATPLFVLSGVFTVLFLCRVVIRFQHRRRLREILQTEDQCKFSRTSVIFAWIKKHASYGKHTLTTGSYVSSGIYHDQFAFLVRPSRLVDGLSRKDVPTKICRWTSGSDEFTCARLERGSEQSPHPTSGHSFRHIQFPAPLGRTSHDSWGPDSYGLCHWGPGNAGWVVQPSQMMAAADKGNSIHGRNHEGTLESAFLCIWDDCPYCICSYFLSISITNSACILRSLSSFSYIPRNHGICWAVVSSAWLGPAAGSFGHRIARLVSILWRNCGKQRTSATVELLPGDVARVEVAVSRPWKFKAGQYMYLYIPSLGLWTSHPFSVAWTSSDRMTTNKKRDSSDSFNVLLGGRQRTTMSFLIKRRDGFTNKLLTKVHRSEAGRFNATALAEGPFGGLHSLASYGTVLLIAGGIGITPPLSYLHEFVDGFSDRSMAVRRVTLVWVVRHLEHLDWIQPWMASLFDHPAVEAPNERKQTSYFQLSEFSLTIQVYVTAKGYTTDEHLSNKSPWTKSPPSTVSISIKHGKPSFAEVVEAEMEQQVGAMAVSVCGPGGMGDDVRQAVRERQNGRLVDLYEDTFSW
ncbi:ferric-chelate reductase, putative [Aspergillus fumigatus A1163]|uniref:ferric-chelate reductase (NADPH) n=1 Tax=Aspergillus fumigatus (strain CBS 144.89 / FGSC A1163 / CEA10) TaxID=451804 RepID=B0XT82_ASPFC|nr:ferric-chelate reductase, putative [Aspergillus fumigatus A1163]